MLRCYAIAGVRFLAGHGWYRVERAVGERLRDVRHRVDDSNSPLAFDVATIAEAMEIDERERGDAGQRRAARPLEPDARPARGGAGDPRRAAHTNAPTDPRKKDEAKKDA